MAATRTRVLWGEKMGAVAECSASIVQSVMQAFPWGWGETVVPVPVFQQADPGNCDPGEHRELQNRVNSACKAGARGC